MVSKAFLQETLKAMKQTGFRESLPRDRGRIASTPGKRVSKYGKIYWETRKNRSDSPGTSV